MRKISLLSLALALIFSVSGCNYLTWPVYVLFGQSNKKVKAEYPGLKNQKTALIVATTPAVDFEYPYIRNDLALGITNVLSQHIKGIKFIPQEKIDAFISENLDWVSLPISQIAARFDAQRILYLDLYEFTLREPESVNLLRGRISAAVRVYEIDSPQPDQPVYQTELSNVYPESGPTFYSDTALMMVRQRTLPPFVDQLARKFYDHKIPVNQGK